MTELEIAYRLDGRQPGYAFTTPTDGLSADTLRTIWQQAMPRGQGWRGFIGARTLKCFAVEGGRRAAIAEVTVTDQKDESGRQGIRRAVIRLLDGAAYLDYLALRLAMLPPDVRKAAGERLTRRRWQRIMRQATPGPRASGGQVVLTAAYHSPEDWQVVEAVVLSMALSQRVRALKGWPHILPLTTLALETREEGRIVAVPRAALAHLNGTRAVDID
ncbi:MAG: hypothetical protein Kow0077_00770 [Anaerolineae bacterium]